jgi:hypothetical protein
LLARHEPNPALQNNRCSFFYAGGARALERTRFDPQEEIETVLVPATRIPDLLDSGQVTHALALCALETYWRKRCAGALPRPVVGGASHPSQETTAWSRFEDIAKGLEQRQAQRVIALARRLRSDLGADDLLNPQDIPELADPDWQFEDGVLSGIREVLAAVRAARGPVSSAEDAGCHG